jgi:hypothetical protein
MGNTGARVLALMATGTEMTVTMQSLTWQNEGLHNELQTFQDTNIKLLSSNVIMGSLYFSLFLSCLTLYRRF